MRDDTPMRAFGYSIEPLRSTVLRQPFPFLSHSNRDMLMNTVETAIAELLSQQELQSISNKFISPHRG